VEYVLYGILWGLVLALLTGPILLVLVQTGIERGFRAGLAVGAGVWLSDLLFIAVSYTGIAIIHDIVDHPNFEIILGTFGGMLLIAFGTGSMVVSQKLSFNETSPAGHLLPKDTVYKKYRRPFVKGFLINTVNPFTVFFWTGIVAKLFVGKGWDDFGVLICLLTILITIVITDSLKVLSAKKLRRLITGNHLQLFRRISGVALIVFGIILLYRVW